MGNNNSPNSSRNNSDDDGDLPQLLSNMQFRPNGHRITTSGLLQQLENDRRELMESMIRENNDGGGQERGRSPRGDYDENGNIRIDPMIPPTTAIKNRPRRYRYEDYSHYELWELQKILSRKEENLKVSDSEGLRAELMESISFLRQLMRERMHSGSDSDYNDSNNADNNENSGDDQSMENDESSGEFVD